jgi:hypothetical protein
MYNSWPGLPICACISRTFFFLQEFTLQNWGAVYTWNIIPFDV